MKKWQWIFLGILSFSLTMWIVIYPYVARVSAHSLSTAGVLAVVVFAVHPLCALWLLVRAIRFERNPIPYVLLAIFVPFACVWYYVERVRQRKQSQAYISPANVLSAGDDSLQYGIRGALWICLGMFSLTFAVTMAFFYPFHRPFYEVLGKARYVVQPILTLQPFGAFWMLYRSIRHESKPLPYILLAIFVPFACVWYYFEKARPRRINPMTHSTGAPKKTNE